MVMMNRIVESKTIEISSPEGDGYAIMIAANVGDPSSLRAFVGELVERTKVQRMISPPSTTHMLISVRGEPSATTIKALWNEYVSADPVMTVFLRALRVADLIVADARGPAREQVSLLD